MRNNFEIQVVRGTYNECALYMCMIYLCHLQRSFVTNKDVAFHLNAPVNQTLSQTVDLLLQIESSRILSRKTEDRIFTIIEN